MGKLTKAQRRILTRLTVGACYPAGRYVSALKLLERRGFATGNIYGAYSITPAGRAALEATDHE